MGAESHVLWKEHEEGKEPTMYSAASSQLVRIKAVKEQADKVHTDGVTKEHCAKEKACWLILQLLSDEFFEQDFQFQKSCSTV